MNAPGGRSSDPPIVPALSLRRNVAWTLAGNGLYAASQWAMLVVLAKLLSSEDVGRFALGLAVTAPVFMFSNLQLRAVQATDQAQPIPFQTYLRLRVLLTALALVVLSGIACGGPYTAATAGVILALAAAKAFESFSDIAYGLLQQRERMDRIAMSMILKGLGSLAALGIAVHLTRSVLWGAAALAGTWALVFFAYDAPNANRIRAGIRVSEASNRWNWAEMKSVAVFALPLGAVTVLLSLNANIPRYFLMHYGGEHDVAMFSAMAYILVAGNSVVSALGQAATPRLARGFAEGNRDDLRKILLRVGAVACVLGTAGIVAAVFAGSALLSLLYRNEYAAYPTAFSWIMVAGAAQYLGAVLGYGVTAARWFRGQLYIHSVCLFAALVANGLLVARFGVEGAALAFALTSSLATAAFGVALYVLMKFQNHPMHIATPGGGAEP